jgi:hypothetical protein
MRKSYSRIITRGEEKPLLILLERAKTANGASFVSLNVEYSVEARDLQNIVHSLREANQLEFTLNAAEAGIGRYHFSNSRAVDVIHIAEVEEYLPVSPVNQILDDSPQRGTTFPQRNFPAEVHNRYVSNFPARSL